MNFCLNQGFARVCLLPTVFLLFWAGLIFAGRANFIKDPGTFWHTVVGERILTSGFADVDEYTFTRAGQTWIPHQWLGEVTMALLHRMNALHGVLAGGTALLAALLTLLFFRWWHTGLHPILIVVFLGVTAASMATHFHLRPHLFTMVGVALTMLFLLEVEAKQATWKFAAWLVPLYLVWANTHGGMVGGLTMLMLAGAGWTVLALLGRASPVRGVGSFFGWLGMGTILGSLAFVTPYGSRIAETWRAIMQAPRLREIIIEHLPFDVTHPANIPTMVVAVVYLVLLASVPRERWRFSWFIPIFWLVQTYERVRHAPLFSISACLVIADLWPHTRCAAWLEQHRPDFFAGTPRAGYARWPALLGIACVLLGGFGWQASRTSSATWAKLDPNHWPTELDEVLAAHAPTDPAHAKIFNDYRDGGYLIYHHPRYRVFVDDRCELYGDEWLVEFANAGEDDAQTPGYMAQAEREYGRFDYALTRLDTAFDRYILNNSEEWEIIKTTSTARFAVRLKPPCCEKPVE